MNTHRIGFLIMILLMILTLWPLQLSAQTDFMWTFSVNGIERWTTTSYPAQFFQWTVTGTATETWYVKMPGETDPSVYGYYNSGGIWYKSGKKVTQSSVTEFRVINGKPFWKYGSTYYYNDLANSLTDEWGYCGPCTASGATCFFVLNGEVYYKLGDTYYHNNLNTYTFASHTWGYDGPCTESGASNYIITDVGVFYSKSNQYYYNNLYTYYLSTKKWGDNGPCTPSGVSQFRVSNGEAYWEKDNKYYRNTLFAYTLATKTWGIIVSTNSLPSADSFYLPCDYGQHSIIRTVTDTGTGWVSMSERLKFIDTFDATPQPLQGGIIGNISYSITSSNSNVLVQMSGNQVYASTNYKVQEEHQENRNWSLQGNGNVSPGDVYRENIDISLTPIHPDGWITDISTTISDNSEAVESIIDSFDPSTGNGTIAVSYVMVPIWGYIFAPYGDGRLQGVCLHGFPDNPITDEWGYYKTRVPFGWSGTVRPELEGYTFKSEFMTYNDVQHEVTWQNYGGYVHADLNRNGQVNLSDYGVFATNWMQSDCSLSNQWCSYSDINHDGQTELYDLLEFADHWMDGISTMLLASHKDNNNPLSEGWNWVGGIEVTTGSVNDGSDYKAWYVSDMTSVAGSTGKYSYPIRDEQVILASQNGWSLSVRVKIAAETTSGEAVCAFFSDGSTRYAIDFRKDASGIQTVQCRLVNGQYTTPIPFEDYQLIELKGRNNAASLYIDGLLQFSNYIGDMEISTKQIDWGSASSLGTGIGYWNLVKFEIYLTHDHDMVYIPGGTFQMGDSFNEGWSNELPVHSVTLSPFYMGKYEITNGQYCDFLNSALSQGVITVSSNIVYKSDSGTTYPYCDTYQSSNYSQINWDGSTFSARTKNERNMANDPMLRISWYGAVAYCNWRSQQEGKDVCYNLTTWEWDISKKGYHLPTEAQWEYATRGGLLGKRFPWGDTIIHDQANYYSSSSYSYDISSTRGDHPTWNDGVYPYTSPVGSFAANNFGLCDMTGNVWEWCNDWYGNYSSGSQTNPTGPATGTDRVCHGGGWGYDAYGCRVACRTYYFPSYRNGDGGFRISLDY